MRSGGKSVTAVLALFVVALTFTDAGALTLAQEKLIDLANRFSVVVTDFEPDGLLTPESVKSNVEQQLTASGLELAPPDSAPPLAIVTVNVAKEQIEDEPEYNYKLDINVYNLSTIGTRFELRKGTVWMIGSYRVTPGRRFPTDVERQISRMLRYFIGDYYTANPSLKTENQ